MSQKSSTSRRTFLKHSAVAAGTLAALQASTVRQVHASAEGPMKIALIGCGGRGTGAVSDCLEAAKILQQPMKLVAVADVFENRARGSLKALKDKWQGAIDVSDDQVFVGLDAYKKAIDCGADLLLMATPPGFRPLHYAAAVEAGKNIFMEKPLCTDAPGYRKIMAASEQADKKGLKVVVGLQRHHQGPYLQGIQEIHDGKLGDIQFLRVYWNGSGGGARDIGPRPQNDPKEMEFQIANWGCFRWLYGDNIVEQHVHNIDIGNWVMSKGGDPKAAHPVEAVGIGGRGNRGNYGDIFDHHYIEFTYADGTKMFSQSRHQPGTWDQVDEFAHGTKESRRVANGDGPKLESGNPYVQEHVDLMKAIAGDKYLNEAWLSAASSMTAVLGRMASDSGDVVTWDDAVANGANEAPDTIAWDAKPKSLPDEKGNYPFPLPGITEAF